MAQPMFLEELDKLRLKLAEAQEQAHTAERERYKASQLYKEHSIRADRAEERVQLAAAEIQALKLKLAESRDQLDRLASVSTERDQALSDLRDEQVRAEKLEKFLNDARKKLKEANTLNVDLQSELTGLKSKLDPTKRVLDAIRAKREADRLIDAEIGNL